MQVTTENLTPTSIKLTIIADVERLEQVKQDVLKRLSKNLRLQGFRPGKAPLNLVERSVDQNQLQTEFLEQAVNDMYVAAVDQEHLRPVAQPQISITKFVPFSTLEITAETDAVGNVTLPDYKKISAKKDDVNITEEQIDAVIADLQKRVAKKQPVERAAKDGDEVTLDFAGVDAKTKKAIDGASGTGYPLTLGSGSFIPGFEEELVGLKTDDDKEFTITFPADYGVVDLQKRKVTFTVTIKQIQEVALPKVDKAFAAEIGPFKSVDELRTDIRRELETQATQEAERKYDNDLVEAIANKTEVAIPDSLVDEELDRLEQQEKQNVVYRGQTWQEHLDQEGVTEDEHRAKNRPAAELRVKAGLVLGEIAETEKITVGPEELEVRIQLLKGQYASDERMLAELDKPENRRDILSRMMTEKTLAALKA